MQNQNTGRASQTWRTQRLHLLVLAFVFMLALSVAACGSDDEVAGEPSDSSSTESKESYVGFDTPEEAFEDLLTTLDSQDKSRLIPYIVDGPLKEAERSEFSRHPHLSTDFATETSWSADKKSKAGEGRVEKAGSDLLGLTPSEARSLGPRAFWIKAISKVYGGETPFDRSVHDWHGYFKDLDELIKVGRLPSIEELAEVRRLCAEIKKSSPEDYFRITGVNNHRAELDIADGVRAYSRLHDGKWYMDQVAHLAVAIVVKINP